MLSAISARCVRQASLGEPVVPEVLISTEKISCDAGGDCSVSCVGLPLAMNLDKLMTSGRVPLGTESTAGTILPRTSSKTMMDTQVPCPNVASSAISRCLRSTTKYLAFVLLRWLEGGWKARAQYRLGWCRSKSRGWR
jgi:hypothetical protein